MKELTDFYKLVWSTYGGSKAFFRGQLIGVGFAAVLGIVPIWFTVSIWSAFTLFTLGVQAYIMLKKAEDATPEFEQGRMALMVRNTLSQYLYTGFMVASLLMNLLMTHFAAQTS